MVRYRGWQIRHAWRNRRGVDVPDYRLVDDAPDEEQAT
jgi:hypothetical protein